MQSFDAELHAALGDEADHADDYYDDGDGGDYPAEGGSEESGDSQNKVATKTGGGEAVLSQAASSQNDYSYFDQALGKNWAGPEHWRMRRIIQSWCLFIVHFSPLPNPCVLTNIPCSP